MPIQETSLKQSKFQVFLLKNFVFHPQPPESGLLESGVRHLNLEDIKFEKTDLLSVPFGNGVKLSRIPDSKQFSEVRKTRF